MSKYDIHPLWDKAWITNSNEKVKLLLSLSKSWSHIGETYEQLYSSLNSALDGRGQLNTLGKNTPVPTDEQDVWSQELVWTF
jgi:hypothetical protein